MVRDLSTRPGEPDDGAVETPNSGQTDCGGAPPLRATVYSRTLQRACEILGGIRPLSQHLGIAAGELAAWIDARGQPPLDVFLRAVDVVLLHVDRTRGSA